MTFTYAFSVVNGRNVNQKLFRGGTVVQIAELGKCDTDPTKLQDALSAAFPGDLLKIAVSLNVYRGIKVEHHAPHATTAVTDDAAKQDEDEIEESVVTALSIRNP